ncbi:hypothetical protein [Burkholderia glumae]|uniref:hypothetical protein n=1 Tax=Burkholderia glumae TaxID=337 RepID=UPI0021517F6D|nr:hypothetical protein [Burkholderia glumae]
MSDKLSDEQLLKIWKCANGTHPDLGIFTRMVIDYGRAVLAAASPAPAIPAVHWQPIETAPKETELLGWREDCGVLLIMHTSFDRWASEAECDDIDEETLFQKNWFGTALPGIMDRLEREQVPTHWMPLPVDPTDDALKAAPAISESEDAVKDT